MKRTLDRYPRSSLQVAQDHAVRAIQASMRAALAAERARQYEVARQLEHVARQLVAQHEYLSECLPALRTQTHSEVTRCHTQTV